MASASSREETGAGAGTAGAGAGAQHAGAGAEVTSDIGQAEANIAQLLEQSQLTFSNDKLVFDLHTHQEFAEVRQREFERAAQNAETLAHAKSVNALELQSMADNQRLARETAADSRRHADSGFQTRLETISDTIAANMAMGRPPVNVPGNGGGE